MKGGDEKTPKYAEFFLLKTEDNPVYNDQD